MLAIRKKFSLKHVCLPSVKFLKELCIIWENVPDTFSVGLQEDENDYTALLLTCGLA
jgi:hypothetical protein